MNDRFNKDFANIFGDAKLDPFAPTVTPSRKQMYPGSVGARTPVTFKSGHDSLTAACRQHKGQP